MSHLHFACHGAHDWSDPMLSSLELAHPDYLLLLAVISDLALDSNRLVTLSACETGITDLRAGAEEFVGLPTGFLIAGAIGAISTLWKVDDAATCALMSALYDRHLRQREAPHAALRGAQRWLRDLTIPDLRDLEPQLGDLVERYRALVGEISSEDRISDGPFFWAAFTFIGCMTANNCNGPRHPIYLLSFRTFLSAA